MKIIVSGACGHMGRELLEVIKSGYRGAELAAMVDAFSDSPDIYKNIGEFEGRADVIIDFSHHSCAKDLTDYAARRGIPIVIATTGHTEEEIRIIEDASQNVAIFRSANMSVGVSLLVELARQAAKAFPEADIEIIETHHNRKLDAPSGTALMIADNIKKVRRTAEYKLGRGGMEKRHENEIGIHAVRMGNVVGEHEVLVATATQTITLKHQAHSRALFAEGAVAAAGFLIGKDAGCYNMYDMLAVADTGLE